jgi:hypothetical protein
MSNGFSLLQTSIRLTLLISPFCRQTTRFPTLLANRLTASRAEEALKEYKEKAKQRKELIRRIWRIFDSVGEQKARARKAAYICALSLNGVCGGVLDDDARAIGKFIFIGITFF